MTAGNTLTPDHESQTPAPSPATIQPWLLFFKLPLAPAGAGTLALFLLSLLAYLPALRAGFVWDDGPALLQNPLLRSLGGLGAIWIHPSLIPGEQHYWPLVYSSFWLEYHIWGLHPFGYHLVNVLLHGLGACLAWRLLRFLGAPGAWLAAALFTLHPVHVESVAWVIERKDVLSTVFYLSAALVYLKFDAAAELGGIASKNKRSTNIWLYGLAVGLFIAAMLSKLAAVGLPLALGLALWWRRGRLRRRDLARLAPFGLIALVITGADVLVYRQSLPYQSGLGLVERLLLASRALVFYVEKLLWPTRLATFYPKWPVDAPDWHNWLFPFIIAAALLLAWAMRRRWGRGPLVALLFYGLTLGPVLGLVDYGFMIYAWGADRFQYLASLGPLALFAAMLTRRRSNWPGPSTRNLAAALILLTLGTLTFRQAGHYHDMESLFRHNVALYPEVWAGHYYLGKSLNQPRQAAEAERAYTTAARLNPQEAGIYNCLAAAQATQGKLEAATTSLRQSVRLDPTYLTARYNLCRVLAERGQRDEAIREYRELLRQAPNFPGAGAELEKIRGAPTDMHPGE